MRFLLLGAGEFLPWSPEAERYVLSDARPGPVAVVPTASAPEGDGVFDRWAEMGLAHYRELGVDARLVGLKTRDQAFSELVLEALEGASMYFFSGGSPLHLARVLDGTPALEVITLALAGGAVFAGCSAGAMVAGARVENARGPEFWNVGLGLVANARFGVHWNRMPGLLPGVKEFAVSGGRRAPHFIGIDEDTAIAGDGSFWRVFGTGRVDVRGPAGRERYAAGDEFTLGVTAGSD